MKTADEVQNILNGFTCNREVSVEIYESYGRVLFDDVYSKVDVPLCDKSTVDGYAITNEGLNNDFLVISDEIHAGDPADMLINPGKCIWVATGSNIPKNTDRIIPFENTINSENTIRIVKMTKNSNIFKKGTDIPKNTKVLDKNTLIDEKAIGILASIGMDNINVYDTPKVAILSVGSELSEINEVNSKTLTAIVRKAGCDPVFLGVVEDSIEKITYAIKNAVLQYDIVVTSGGTSKGKKDYMFEIISSIGDILFHKVKSIPGMPIFAGKVSEKPIICLPGNVASCLVCGYAYLLPMFLNTAHKTFKRELVTADLSEEFNSELGIKHYFPVKLKDGIAYPAFRGSNMITSIANADGLVDVSENEVKVRKNVKIWLI
ncbi:molybdopterin-binding protein [Methanococcus maripaludis]|uniref:molybdopterin molybdotransferase MoeA n=1 Tax=Methanococcus maripaludis TaxID=39152 RepID=UPI0031415FB5